MAGGGKSRAMRVIQRASQLERRMRIWSVPEWNLFHTSVNVLISVLVIKGDKTVSLLYHSSIY